MKIFILAIQDGPPWACDNIRSDWQLFFPQTDASLQDCDVIWLLSNWQWQTIPESHLVSKKVVCTIHHIVEEKFNQVDFEKRDKFVDVYHAPCEITKNIISKYTTKKIRVLPYWYNEKIWYAQKNIDSLKNKHGLPKDKTLIGSFQRDTEGSDLKSPKLEKGPDLFCDTIESLKTKPHVILTGWRREYVLNRLRDKQISYSYFEMADFKTMNDLYNCLDYYLITSRAEGGPQSLLEGSACGTRVLSTNVGMATEVLPANFICEDKEDFINNINSKPFADSRHLNFEIKKVLPKYFDFFTNV